MELLSAASSPLADLERTVQQRAKDAELDPARPEAAARIRSLVLDEITRWNDEHARGA